MVKSLVLAQAGKRICLAYLFSYVYCVFFFFLLYIENLNISLVKSTSLKLNRTGTNSTMVL